MRVKLLFSEAFFRPQMQQIFFSGRAPPGPGRAGTYSAPQAPYSWIKGRTSNEGEGKKGRRERGRRKGRVHPPI